LVICLSSPLRKMYARLSPTWPTNTVLSMSAATVDVVPMPRRLRSARAASKIRPPASSMARTSARASASRSLAGTLRRIISKTVSTAIWLATSPAAAPPMPSHTARSRPEGETSWNVLGSRLPVPRSASSRLSSLCSRTRPTSVRPTTDTVMAPAGRMDTGTGDPAASLCAAASSASNLTSSRPRLCSPSPMVTAVSGAASCKAPFVPGVRWRCASLIGRHGLPVRLRSGTDACRFETGRRP
jgi:hypothetical protein